jgi:hypothetical protein
MSITNRLSKVTTTDEDGPDRNPTTGLTFITSSHVSLIYPVGPARARGQHAADTRYFALAVTHFFIPLPINVGSTNRSRRQEEGRF